MWVHSLIKVLMCQELKPTKVSGEQSSVCELVCELVCLCAYFHKGICVYVYVTVNISLYTESSLNSKQHLTTWHKGYEDR